MATPVAAPSYRVLVVDDDPHAVDMVARMLHGRYVTVGAVGAGQAMALADQERFDAALVDQRLSDGTGTAVLAHCAERSPLCRRIAMSGDAEMGELLAAVNIARASRFLLKPFSQERLLSTLAEAMAEYEAERAALERLLIERGAEAATRWRVGERRGGRRARGRGRPPSWPVGPRMPLVGLDDPSALYALFDPEVGIAVASLRPERPLGVEEWEAWAAELELRLVTRLRDADQPLRTLDSRFAVVFARTSREGCRRACRRLGEGLRGGLLFEVFLWPEAGSRPVPELVENILRG